MPITAEINFIEDLQKKINDAIIAGNKTLAVELSEKLTQYALREDAKAFVVNITARSFWFDRSYGRVTVYGTGDKQNPLYRKEDEAKGFAVSEIEPRGQTMDVLKGIKTVRYPARGVGDPMADATVVNGVWVAVPAILVARDVVQDANSNLPFSDLAHSQFHKAATNGLFIAGSSFPTDDELKAERDKLVEYYKILVFYADQQWKRSPDSRLIYDSQRNAVEYLGLAREYASTPEMNVPCPGCGEPVRQGVAVCRHCSWIIDEEKVAAQEAKRQKLGLAVMGEEETPKPKGKGKDAN